MNGKNKSFGVIDIVLLVAAVVFLIGVFTVFSACGPKEDGTWMVCHWAGQTVRGIALTAFVTTLVHVFVKNPGTKAGISMALIPEMVLAMSVPGGIINLCMMNNMHCHTMMRPGVCICSGLILIAAVFDIFLQLLRNKKQND